MNTPTEPTVQAFPVFKKGEKLRCKSSKTELTVLEVTPAGYRCKGRAGILPKEAAEKIS